MDNWKLEQPKNEAVFTTKFVVKDKKPILRVYYDSDDGSWQFHHDPESSEDDSMIVSLSEIIMLDESINQLSTLQEGYCAVRNDENSE